MADNSNYDPTRPPYYGMAPDSPVEEKKPVKKAAAKEKDAE